MATYGTDTSHYQSVSDMGAAGRSGNVFNIAKATEGNYGDYRDPAFPLTRTACHDTGVLPGSYHFARPGDPVGQANFYLDVASPVAGELVSLDFEDQAITDGVGFSVAFCRQVIARTGTPPLVYLNTFFLQRWNWQPVVDLGCGLWFAKYDGNPDPTVNVLSGQFPVVAIKQYSNDGAVPGISSPVDRDSFAGTIDQLRKYTVGGGSAPPPPPPPPPPPIVIPHPGIVAWVLPPGQCFGSISNPSNAVHGGFVPWETGYVKNIQQWLIYRGCTSVAASRWEWSTWADGRWGPETDTAMVTFHQRFYPNQPKMNQCWADDYSKLARP